MGKVEKKRAKIAARIEQLEEEMTTNLRQKTSNTAEINVSKYLSEIEKLRKEMTSLK